MAIAPGDRHKTQMVFPMALGGTTFQWVACPYGLARAPAVYSKALQFTLQAMREVRLVDGRTGSVNNWLDDIIFHASSIEGFIDIFERILERLAAAGISLKPSKCDCLRESLEILGFVFTPRGI